MLSKLHNFFSRVLLESLACLKMWFMTGTHVLQQSSGLNSSTPLDLTLYLVVLTIPKQMVKWRNRTECWTKLLDVSWLNSPCLNQNGVTYCVMLSLPSTQWWKRALVARHLSWCMGNWLDCLLISLWELRLRCLMRLTSLSTSSE